MSRKQADLKDSTLAEAQVVTGEVKVVEFDPMEDVAPCENPHSGDTILEDYMKPLGMTAYRLAKGLRMQQIHVSRILQGKQAVTPATALRLSRFLGNPPEWWLGLQMSHDLRRARVEMEAELAQITPVSEEEKERARQLWDGEKPVEPTAEDVAA
jgi:antitoxin HigA-1